MVGPSTTDTERRAASRRLQAGFVGLVTLSGGLTAAYAGGAPTLVASGLAGGLLVGLALRWFLLRWARQFRPRRPRGR
jgi:hypothetical protein